MEWKIHKRKLISHMKFSCYMWNWNIFMHEILFSCVKCYEKFLYGFLLLFKLYKENISTNLYYRSTTQMTYCTKTAFVIYTSVHCLFVFSSCGFQTLPKILLKTFFYMLLRILLKFAKVKLFWQFYSMFSQLLSNFWLCNPLWSQRFHHLTLPLRKVHMPCRIWK